MNTFQPVFEKGPCMLKLKNLLGRSEMNFQSPAAAVWGSRIGRAGPGDCR